MMDFELIGFKELLSMGNNQYYGYRLEDNKIKFYYICGNSSTDSVHIDDNVDRYDVIEEYYYKEERNQLTYWEKKNCEILWGD
jgi:hypothetical protein